MKCPKCQHENPEGARFCMGCGYNLTLSSEPAPKDLSYDEKLAKIQRYLPKGITEKILSQREKIEGELRQVTVVFCDMEGFTPLVEKLGPEEAYSIMDDIYEILIHKVHDYDGTVNEMTGDGIMALFGAPIALEDAAQKAIRSALSIHREIAQFNDQRQEIKPIKMRIGIHTGPVVIGTLGNDLRVEFKAVGDTVNLASRMESLSVPGTTYVTEDIFKLTKGLFRYESLGGIEVKGKKEPIRIYKLLSAKEDVFRPRIGAERIIYSEMVGRDKELDRLELQVMKVINGEGSIVNIIGEAGIGKSRLVAELKNREVMKRVSLFEGRSISTGQNLSFHPIISLLKHWARIRGDDSDVTTFSKLQTAIMRVHPEEMYEVLPFVATIMGMKLSGRYAERLNGIEGEALEKLILKNVRELLIKATELSPLVIVMEDLHWADLSSVELMESLFRLAENQGILFINVFRPGYKKTGDRIVENIKERLSAYYIEIVLQSLDERVSETLINNMLNIRGLHHAVIDQIVERSDGNPFFIEEVVNSFIDEGAVVVKDGFFEVTEKIDTMVIPYTINDVLMARIDRLEEKTRNLVKVASVIGRNFFYRILVEVAETIENIDRRLGYLKEIQLILERRRLNELEYLFKHALAQEAAYESILLQKRKELHLMVADSIENIFSTKLHEFYGMLAFHYSSGEDIDKAEEYMIKAGKEALKSSASSEALHYYQGALNLYLKKYGDSTDPAKVATLEKNIAFALYNKGQYLEAIEYFDKLFSFMGVKVPKHFFLLTVRFFFCIFSVFFSLYFPRLKWKKNPTHKDLEIINLYSKKIHALSQTNPHKMFIESFFIFKKLTNFDLTKVEGGTGLFLGLACIFTYTGIFFKLSKRILDFCKDKIISDDLRSLIYFELSSLMYNYYKGDWSLIKKSDDNLIDKNLNRGEIFLTTQCLVYRGCIKIEMGSFRDAQEIVERLSEITNVYENQQAAITKYELNTNLLVKSRKLYEALKEVEKGISLTNKLGLKVYLSFFYTSKAQVQMMLRDIEGAEESLLNAEKYQVEAKSILDYLLHFWIRKLEFYFYYLEETIKVGDNREAVRIRKAFLKLSKRAVKISKKVATYRTELFRIIGNYYWLIGKQKIALEWWNNSIFEGKQIGTRLELFRTYFEIGKKIAEPNSRYNELKGIKAEEFLARARTIFEEIDLQWDLDELDRLNL